MIKLIKKLSLLFFISLFLLLLILVLVNCIPMNSIENNVEESLPIFFHEGAFPRVKFAYKYLLDNYTDALMINTAYSVDTNEPVKSSMLMRRNYRPNEELYLEKIDNENNTIENLQKTLEKSNNIYYEYSRYWHGYMIYLRPLLVFFNYSQIRIILQVTITVLSLMLVYLTYKKINLYISIATIIMLIISNFYFIGMSIQYSSVFIIMLLSSICIIIRYENIKDFRYTFFIIGILTSFFDLLTTPILTFGIPFIYLVILKNNNEGGSLKTLLKMFIFWILGYGMMWASKWIISDTLYNTGTISRAIQKVFQHTNNGIERFNVTAGEVIFRNLIYVDIAFVFIIICIITILLNRKHSKNVMTYLLIAVIPFVWYIVLKYHSYIHARFTFRNLLITIFACSVIIMNNIKEYISTHKNHKLRYSKN